MHARYAAHARTCFSRDFVSIENKGSKIKIPKLDVAGSIPVARSNFPQQNRKRLSRLHSHELALRKRLRNASCLCDCRVHAVV
jgi:hypothetical protein